jgi:RND superfamily putative drug exporter
MFPLLGRFVQRFSVFVLLGWLALFVVCWRFAPPWQEVARDQEFAFLPPSAPSRQADAMYQKAFPDDRLASNIVLVLYRTEGGPDALKSDLSFIDDVLQPALVKVTDDEGGLANTPSDDEPLFGNEPAAPVRPRSIIARIRTPNAPGVGTLLVSPDHKASLVVVDLTTEFLAEKNWPTIERVEKLAGELRGEGKLPPGLNIAITGSAVIGRDHTHAQLQSAQATGWLTLLLVVGLLAIIYRAPLLALIPLATVYLAVQTALYLLAILARAGQLTLFEGIQIYITIVTYGAGVDYCLFLTARWKEELDRGTDRCQAMGRALGDVGAAVTASAFTVICGIGMMAFADFGKFHEAGLAMPLSLFLVMVAALTFSPALLCLFGRWAFWPLRRPDAKAPLDHPESGAGRPEDDVYHRTWARVGEVLLRRPGMVWLATVAVMTPFVVLAGLTYERVSYDVIGELPADAPSVAGTRILQEHFPAGLMGPVTVLLIDPKVDFGGAQGRTVVAQLTDHLARERETLGLNDIRSLTRPLGIRRSADAALADIDAPADLRREAEERAAREHYITDLGERAKVGTRLELILNQSPFDHRSIAGLGAVEAAVRDALPQPKREQAQLYFVGSTASLRDMATVTEGDRGRIQVLVLASVFVILLLILRRLVLSIYLLLSVLFSYYVTMGVTFAVFWALDPYGFAGIDWKVAIFLFTILIAVGEDYNIFLMTRVHEEERIHGPLRGITEALTRTGPIISSCGVIMAGTFASLMGGSLTDMKQLGFALAFGVLLDTFVVRPVLVPAFLVLWRHWTSRSSDANGASAPSSLVPFLNWKQSRPTAPRRP